MFYSAEHVFFEGLSINVRIYSIAAFSKVHVLLDTNRNAAEVTTGKKVT